MAAREGQQRACGKIHLAWRLGNQPPPQVRAIVLAAHCFSDSACLTFARYSYVGEVGLWTGISLLSTGSLRTPYFPRGAWLLAGASPFLTWFLLRNVSGVPPLEVHASRH